MGKCKEGRAVRRLSCESAKEWGRGGKKHWLKKLGHVLSEFFIRRKEWILILLPRLGETTFDRGRTHSSESRTGNLVCPVPQIKKDKRVQGPSKGLRGKRRKRGNQSKSWGTGREINLSTKVIRGMKRKGESINCSGSSFRGGSSQGRERDVDQGNAADKNKSSLGYGPGANICRRKRTAGIVIQ